MCYVCIYWKRLQWTFKEFLFDLYLTAVSFSTVKNNHKVLPFFFSSIQYLRNALNPLF